MMQKGGVVGIGALANGAGKEFVEGACLPVHLVEIAALGHSLGVKLRAIGGEGVTT